MILFSYFVMCMIFSTTFLVIKVGIDAGAPPFFSAGIRFFLAGLILFLWMVWKRKARVSLLLRREMFFTGMGLTFGVFSALYWAEQYMPSGIAAVLSATAPLMVLLLQNSISRQKISVTSMAGCIIGFAGVLLLLLPSIRVKFDLYWILGSIAILAGQLCYSVGAVYSKRVIQRFEDTSPIALNAAQMMYGGVMLMVLSLCTEQVDMQFMLSLHAALSLLYLIFAGSMLGHSIFYWLVAKTNPVLPSTWLYISPLMALGLGALLYDEQLSFSSLAGGITIIIGIALVNYDTLSQLVAKKPNVLRHTSNQQYTGK